MIWLFIRKTLGGLWGYVAAAGAALAAVAAIYVKGLADAKSKSKLRDAQDHINTRKEVDDAISDARSGGDAWHDRLRRDKDQR